jgi:RHS repeat-associated protein
VVALTDEDGELLETVEYDVYGASAVTQHNGASPTGNRFLFTGREQDAETGLYHYRARAYSPYLGRFLQRDRISYDTFLSLYAYVENDPINRVDPVGLHWFREEEEARLKKETEEAWERAVVESKISPWATWEGFRTTEIWDNFNFPKDIMAVANQNLNAARAWVDSNLYDPFRDPFFRQEVIQKLLNPTMEQYWNNLQQEFGAAIGADVEKGQNMYVLKLSNVSKGTAVPLNTPSAEVTIKGIQQGMLWVGNVHTHPGTGGPSNFDINGAIDKKRPDWVVDCDRTVWVVSSSGVVREYYHKLVPPALTSLVY